MFTVEEIDNDVWGVIDEGFGITGSIVLGKLGKESTLFYAELMNAVYFRIKKDVEDGYIKQ